MPFISLRSCGCVFSDAAIRAVVPTLSKGLGVQALAKEVRDEVKADAKPLASGSTVAVDGEGKSVACPNCGKDFDPTKLDAVLPINPSKEVQETLLENLLATRAAAKSGKKRKAAAVTAAALGGPTVRLHRAGKYATAPRGATCEAGSSEWCASGAPPAHRPSPAAAALTAEQMQSNNLHRSVHQKLAEQEQKRLAAQAGMSRGQSYVSSQRQRMSRGRVRAMTFSPTYTRVSRVLSMSICSDIDSTLDRFEAFGTSSHVSTLYSKLLSY